MTKRWVFAAALWMLACGGLISDPGRRATVTPSTDAQGITLLANTDTDGARLALSDSELLIGCFDSQRGWLLATPKAGGDTRLITRLPRVLKGIEVDGDTAWVATWGGLYAVSISSGEKERIGDYGKAHAVALSASHVVWLAEDGLWAQARSGGAPTHLVSERLSGGAVGIVGEFIYFGYYRGLFRIPISGGEPVLLAEHASPNEGSRMFARGDDLLVDLGVGGPTAFPMSGGERTPACTQVWDHRGGFVATETGMYWGAHEVVYGSVDNLESPRDWQRNPRPRHKQGSAGGVYFCGYGAASETTNLAPNTKDILDIVVDDTHVYWLDKWTGAVGRSPR